MKIRLIQPPIGALRTLYYATAQCTHYEPEPYTFDKDNPDTIMEEKAKTTVMNAIKSGHDSVLEHVSFTFRISDISRTCTHQLVRHRVASYSQCSGRYVNAKYNRMIYPSLIKADKELFDEAKQLVDANQQFYQKCINNGIPKEDARFFLPEGISTAIVVTMNCRELIHFFNLRCCFRAQWEIRTVAWRMLSKCKQWLPWVFDNVGPQCWKLGHCPEVRKCNKYNKELDMLPKDGDYYSISSQKDIDNNELPTFKEMEIAKTIYEDV